MMAPRLWLAFAALFSVLLLAGRQQRFQTWSGDTKTALSKRIAHVQQYIHAPSIYALDNEDDSTTDLRSVNEIKIDSGSGNASDVLRTASPTAESLETNATPKNLEKQPPKFTKTTKITKISQIMEINDSTQSIQTETVKTPAARGLYYNSPSYQRFLAEKKQKPSTSSFFKHHADPSLILVQSNSGSLRYALNQICALTRINASSMANYVIWAMDSEVVQILEKIRSEQSTNAASTDEWQSTMPLNTDFGIFYDPQYESTSGEVRGSPEYKKMMAFRPKFWLKLLKDYAISFVNMDSDVVWFSDPLESLANSPTPTSHSTEYNETPDVTYSTDGRSFYWMTGDHYRISRYGGTERVPPICAGLFKTECNNRTIELYEKLVASGQNDQYGIDWIFRNEEMETIIVDPLPEGLKRAWTPPKGKVTSELRVKILDQLHFPNGALYHKLASHGKLRTGRNAMHGRYSQMRKSGDKPAMVHANWPSRFKDKEAGMSEFLNAIPKPAKPFFQERFGLWFLDDELRCMRDIPNWAKR